MSLNDFSTENRVVTVNGRRITDWGETAAPVTNATIDPKGQLRRGQGGGACALYRGNPGRAVNIYLNPGSPDSAYMQGLYNSKAKITLTDMQIGTLEVNTGVEGMIVSDGQQDRGGSTISDDQYTIHFNGWTASKGGE
jgi:hypothetical protein